MNGISRRRRKGSSDGIARWPSVQVGAFPSPVFLRPLHPSSFNLRTSSERASALITTLLVLVVLSAIVVAFVQSMGIERRTAKSSANILQANLLADAAADEAIQRLLTATTNGPLASIWDRDPAGNPYLFLGKRISRGGRVVTTRGPLFSTSAGNADYFEDLSAAQILTGSISVADLDARGNQVTRSVNTESDLITKMNAASSLHANGMVGLMNGSLPRPLPVNWTYVRESSGRVIGRYGFWVDDECSKLDLRFAGQAANAGGIHNRSTGTNLSDLSLLVLTNAPVNATTKDIANLLALRTLAFSDSALVQYPLVPSATGLDAATWQRLRPYVTVHSLHDDRSPDGKRRLDLNDAVTSANTAARIQAETFAIRDAITNNLPDFGLRFFSADAGAAATPTAADQLAYVTRIAANIRDAIDPDSVATIIQSDNTAYASNSPSFIPYGADDKDLPIAFGKEAGPFLSEYFRIVRVISPLSPTGKASSTPVSVVVRFAHYVELHNPTARPIAYADLGPDPFVMLSNRRSWNNTLPTGSPSVLRLADIKIRLPATFSIPAGGFAVLTTDGEPWSDSQTDFIGSASNRYVISAGTGPGQWELVNTDGTEGLSSSTFEDYTVSVAAITGNKYSLETALDSSATYLEQRERLALGNQEGLIDYTLRIYTDLGGNKVGRNGNNPAWVSTFLSDSETEVSNTLNSSKTEPRFARGDVRSNTEVSRIAANTSACWKDGGIKYGNTLYSEVKDGGPQQTLGQTNYKTAQDHTGVALWRQGWREYTPDPAGNHFVANRRMGSPGELGAIYDPARHDIDGFRSQGATLRIGHSDAPTNNRANSTGVNFQNWLGGRGSDDVTSTNSLRNASLLLDVFRTDEITAGRVNPNSIVRDSAGLAFRSVLDQFVFAAAATNQASQALAGRSVNATNTLSSLQSFVTNPANGFLVSVGDLSRSPLFSTSTNALAGTSMLGVSDAGREEFLRRAANLLTTHSLAFTVFIRAQAGKFERSPDGTERFRVQASTAREMIVQLQPVYPAAANPLVPTAPDSWRILRPRTRNY
jgi:hypothetical protein